MDTVPPLPTSLKASPARLIALAVASVMITGGIGLILIQAIAPPMGRGYRSGLSDMFGMSDDKVGMVFGLIVAVLGGLLSVYLLATQDEHPENPSQHLAMTSLVLG